MFRLPVLLSACLLSFCGVAYAAAPPPDDPIAPLTSAYARAVIAGDDAEAYGELLGTALKRVQRSYAQEIEMGPLVATAVESLAAVEAGTAEPAAAFKKAINA